jgi:hypothetical protein
VSGVPCGLTRVQHVGRAITASGSASAQSTERTRPARAHLAESAPTIDCQSVRRVGQVPEAQPGMITRIVALVGWTALEPIVIWALGIFQGESA